MTDADLKGLRAADSIAMRYIVPSILGLQVILYIGVGVRNFWQCARIAKFDNLTFGDVFSRWIDGIDISATYSGVYLSALERLENGLLYFGGALITFLMLIVFIVWNRRQRRIFHYIDSIRNSA